MKKWVLRILPGILTFTAVADATVSNEDFLKYNYRELARLAARGNAKQKDWLHNYLEDCDDGVEKRSLQEVLEGEQP